MAGLVLQATNITQARQRGDYTAQRLWPDGPYFARVIGRAALGPLLRELFDSELMHCLKYPGHPCFGRCLVTGEPCFGKPQEARWGY